ncbi:MAG: hypothetical protein WD875_06185 [Pirellulales bacterium]
MAVEHRREFLAQVGRGMIVASVGYATAFDMGLAPAWADDGPDALTFGDRERLVAMLQETPADKILSATVEQLKSGTKLRDIVAAAALANARTFGGEDYVGFHTMMALEPAFHMAKALPKDRRALPVLKVLHRNSRRIGEFGGHEKEVLHAVAPATLPSGKSAAEAIHDAVRGVELKQAEGLLVAAAARSADQAFNDLLETVCDEAEVHRVVLAHRAWDMHRLAGEENAGTLLRQSLRYCLRNEERAGKNATGPRATLPRVFDQFKLAGRSFGDRQVDDAWVERVGMEIFAASADRAADIVAGAIAEGIAPTAISEAVSLATNQLVLRDSGRTGQQIQPGKPEGSVHGDSIGVHACDSANAWRHIALVSNTRNAMASLILSGYQAARDRSSRGGDFLNWKPRPLEEQLEKVASKQADELASQLDGAIREQNQELAAAIVHRYGALGHPTAGVIDVLVKFAISEDGALHAEKYFRTTTDEFASARPAFRWRQLVGLARVTASEFGQPAPGYEEACRLLGV